jgi:acyl-CoA thioesterase-1
MAGALRGRGRPGKIEAVPPPRRRPAPPARSPAPRRRLAWRLGGAVLVLLAGTWWWAGGSKPAPPPPLDPARETVVFLGNSITSGHGLPLEDTFPHRLGLLLGVPVRNAGISGDVTAGGLARLERDVLPHRPKLVVVELGANDVFRRLSRDDTFGNLRAIVRRLRDDGAGVVLVHIGIGPLAGGDYLEGYRAIAREEGTWLVEDFLGGVVPGYSTDGLHPNQDGHARLAARLEPLLREILGR